MRPYTYALVLMLVLPALLVLGWGCGATTDLRIAYTGGGLPPGDTDLGGIVVAAAPAPAGVAPAQGSTVPVAGATVTLFSGDTQVGQTQTGPQGYFRFENPRTGAYLVRVDPPAGSGLQSVQRQFRHRYGRRTFEQIFLPPA